MFPLRDINPTRITPVITFALIAISVLVYVFQPRADVGAEFEFLYENAAIACELTSGEPLTDVEITSGVCGESGSEIFPDKQVYLAAVISMFLHGGLIHLLGNMWFLWIFGNNIEEAFGKFGFLLMYVVTGLAATAAFVLTNAQETMPLVGASGAIAGVLGSYLVLFPKHKVMTLIFVLFVPVSALLFLGLWFFSQFLLTDTNVAWQAHVGGFLAGVLITLPLRDRLLARIAALHSVNRVVIRERF